MYSNFKNLCFVLLLLSFLQSAIGQVGINTATPLSMLDINGGPSGNAKLIDDGVYVSLTPTSGNVEFIVPDAATVPGRIYILRNISASLNALLYSFGGKFYAKDSKDPTPPTGTSFLTLPSNALLKTVIVISDGENWTYFF
jgi:hypothetical protein